MHTYTRFSTHVAHSAATATSHPVTLRLLHKHQPASWTLPYQRSRHFFLAIITESIQAHTAVSKITRKHTYCKKAHSRHTDFWHRLTAVFFFVHPAHACLCLASFGCILPTWTNHAYPRGQTSSTRRPQVFSDESGHAYSCEQKLPRLL